MGLFSRAFKKPAQVSLVRKEQTFFLRFLYDDRPVAYADVREKWQELDALNQFVRDHRQNSVAVKLSEVTSLKATMKELRNRYSSHAKLNFYISAAVEAAEMSEAAPTGYVVRYIREGNSLRRILPEGTTELEEGWMRLGNHYWRFEGLDEKLLDGFRRDVIDLQSIISFLKEDLGSYSHAGVPVECEVSWREKPAVEISISSFKPDSMILKPVWYIDLGTVDESFVLDDYVLANHVVCPGILPSRLRVVFPDMNEPAVLEGCDAARFLDEYYVPWKSHLIGDIAGFEKTHRWIEPPYQWILIARAKDIRGIGRAYAHPCANIGGEEFSVDQIREMLKLSYVRIASGWVRNRDLRSLGMDENAIMEDGTTLKPIRLDTDLLLHRGGRKLDTIFSGMRLSGVPWHDQGDKQSCAGDHLGFLTHWGINGGLIGGYEAMVAYGMPFLSRFCQSHKDAKVLILGGKSDCAGMFSDSLFYIFGLRGDHIQLFSYDEACHVRSAEERNAQWDLMCLIEPDVELLRASSRMIQTITSLKAACKIGFFLKAPTGNYNGPHVKTTSQVTKENLGRIFSRQGNRQSCTLGRIPYYRLCLVPEPRDPFG